MAIGSALVVALLGGTIVLFQTEVMWDMDSPNAQSWNATLNTTATFGINIIPMLIIIIVAFVCIGIAATSRGF